MLLNICLKNWGAIYLAGTTIVNSISPFHYLILFSKSIMNISMPVSIFDTGKDYLNKHFIYNFDLESFLQRLAT